MYRLHNQKGRGVDVFCQKCLGVIWDVCDGGDLKKECMTGVWEVAGGAGVTPGGQVGNSSRMTNAAPLKYSFTKENDHERLLFVQIFSLY